MSAKRKPISKYVFHRLEYKHCIAYARALTDILPRLKDVKFLESYDMRFHNNVLEYIESDDSELNEVWLDFGQSCIDKNRVGNLGPFFTHCLNFDLSDKTLVLDRNEILRLNLNDMDYSEESFFQYSLLYEPNDLLYTIVFPYLHEHLKGTTVQRADITFSLVNLFKYSDVFKEICIKGGYFDDLADLNNMAFENDNYFNDTYIGGSRIMK